MKPSKFQYVLVSSLAIFTTGTTIADSPFFAQIDPASGYERTVGHAVSNGENPVATGYMSLRTNTYEGYRWTRSTGTVGIGYLPVPNGNYTSSGAAISADGRVIAGRSRGTGTRLQAIRHTQADGVTGLGYIDYPYETHAHGISDDGNVIVGHADLTAGMRAAVRWTEGTGLVKLPGFPEESMYSIARSASVDGTVIVGASDIGGRAQAFRWTEETGPVVIEEPGSETESDAYDVSADGSVIVGKHGSSAFRWTEETGIVELGDVPGSSTVNSTAFGISADGTRIVGRSDSRGEAFIWDEGIGMRSLIEVLQNDHGLDLGSMCLSYASGISPDGKNITGWGWDNGKMFGFVAHIPEPSALFLMAIGYTLVVCRRR